jgi:hypothetical protein
MTVIFLRDIDEKHAPPALPQLRLAIVGEAVFVEVVKETSEVPATYERGEAVAVPFDALLRALGTLASDQDAHDRWQQ